MKIEELFFWREFSPPRQRAFFQLVGLGSLLVFFLVWLWLWMGAADAQDRLRTVREQDRKVSPLIQEVMALEARQVGLSNLGPLAAAQQVARDQGLDKKLSSIRPAQLGGSQDGVQVYFEGLNLPEMLGLLSNLKHRAGLRVVSCQVNRRMDAADLADVQMALTR